jgi:DivIVA domain-containing protein
VGTVLAVLGVLAVLFVAALVATRDGEILVDAPRDRPDPDLPADGRVRADDLERVRFGMALRGYRMSEVDDLLDRVAAELRERDERIRELEAGVPDDAPATRATD